MPFAGYKDFDDCVKKNKDKKDPEGYCASIQRKTEKKPKKKVEIVTFKSFVSDPKMWTEKNGEVEKVFMRVPLSGNGEDRHGERISVNALRSMESQLNKGKIPFYSNHGESGVGLFGPVRSYRWQDMMGVWTKGELEVVEGKSVGSEKVYKLFGTIMINGANPDAQNFVKYAEAGMPLGFSIGGKVLKEFDEVVEYD